MADEANFFKGTQIVDSLGNPQVMYHGTKSVIEDGFKGSKAYNRRNPYLYFSSNPEVANQFTRERSHEPSNDAERGEVVEGGNVVPVYLNLKKVFNPEELSDLDWLKSTSWYKENKQNLDNQFGDPDTFDDPDNAWRFLDNIEMGDSIAFEKSGLLDVLKEAGYEGWRFAERGQMDSVGVFDSKNIKMKLDKEDPVTSDKLLTLTKLLGSRIQPMALPPEERKGQQVSRPTNLQKLTRGIGSLARKSPLVSLARMGLDQIPAERRQQVIDYLKNATTHEMFSQGLAYFKDLFSSYNTGGIASLSPEDIKRIQEKGWEHHLTEGLPVGEPAGLSAEQVESLIKPILEKLPYQHKQQVKVMDQAPSKYFDERGVRGFMGRDPRSGAYPGAPLNQHVRVLANRAKTPLDAERTLLHELYGHKAVGDLFHKVGRYGKDSKVDFLDSLREAQRAETLPSTHHMDENFLKIYEGIGGMEGIRKYAPENFNIEKYLDLYKEQGFNEDQIKASITDELFAWIAGDNNPSINRYVSEIMGSVRNWMREKGFSNISKVGKSDLLHILRQSRRYLQRPDLTPSLTLDPENPSVKDVTLEKLLKGFKKAEGGFIDGPLYTDARMIG
mgnify:CR=1 FL=1